MKMQPDQGSCRRHKAASNQAAAHLTGHVCKHACMHTRWPLPWKATHWLSSGSVVTIFIKEDPKKVYSSFFFIYCAKIS